MNYLGVVEFRVVSRVELMAGVPGAPGAPASVDRVIDHGTLGRVLTPVGGEVAVGRLSRGGGALHQVLVPAAVGFLGVYARLGIAVTVALNRWYPEKNSRMNPAFQCQMTLGKCEDDDYTSAKLPASPRRDSWSLSGTEA